MKIVKVAVIAGLAGLGAAMGPMAANAQSLPVIGGPSSISAGIFAPTSDDAKHGGGKTQFDANFRYTLPVPNPLDVPARTVLDLGVQTGARDGKHSTVVPITVGEVVGLSGKSPNAAGEGYAGVGVGAYIINQSGLSTATRLGGFGELGYNINSSFFVDARYQFVQHANGPLFNVGYRF